jgi:hypothetical protein
VGPGGLRGKTTSQPIIRKEAIVGLKLTIRHFLLSSCACLLLAPACATSSKAKTARRAPAPAKQKAPAAPIATAGSAADGKGKSNPPAPSPAKPAKAAAPVQAKKPPAPPPEPEIPARLPQPLYCPTPSEVQAGAELTIRCAARPALGTPKVVLNYRPSGTDHFTMADATRSPKGWYVVKIRAADVKGTSLQFFAQAYNANNRVTASNGNDESPNILLIRQGAAAAEQAGLDEDPLAHVQREKDAEILAKNQGPRLPPNRVWVGLGMGTGWGWFPKRAPEAYPLARVEGWASGGILHLLPEIGYQWTPHVAFSVQGRYQFVLTDMGAGCTINCPRPKDWAYAVLGRVYLFTDRVFGRASHMQVFGTGTLGGGTAFRLYVAPKPSANPNANFRTSDTVAGGPLAAGLGGGVIYHFTNYLAVAAELRALAGFWEVATVLEGGVSAQLGFWSPGERRAPPPPPAFDLPPEPDYPGME